MLGALALRGAAASATQASAPTAQAEKSQSSTEVGSAFCESVSDVLTIADLGLHDGRIAPQEQQGWHALATRVLHRISSDGDSALDQAVAELQGVAPEIPLGAKPPTSKIDSPEWHEALATSPRRARPHARS